MTPPQVNPEVLLVARDSRGRTQKDVADAAGVSQGLISKVEDGVVPMTDGPTIKAIADFLDYPQELFFEPGRVREVGSACLYHRKRKTLPAKVLKKIDARMYVRNINVRRLLDGLEIQADRSFHTMDPDEYGGSPMEVARALRAAWRVPEGPIPNLTALIESAGGVVIMEDFGNRKLFGMSCWTTRGHPLFFLNSAMDPADLRWTMAHELGHLTMHAGPPDDDPELQADAFAGEFLAPQALFRHDVRRLTFDRLPALKTYWRLSMKAIIKRAHAIDAIDQATAVKLYKQHSARGYNTAEPYAIAPEPPTLVGQAVDVHLHEHGYNAAELAQAIRMSKGELFRDLLRRPMPEDNVISLFDRPPGLAGPSSA